MTDYPHDTTIDDVADPSGADTTTTPQDVEPGLPDRVADLEANMSSASRLLALLAGADTEEDPDDAQPDKARHPWLLLADIDDDAPFTTWVAWLGSHYTDPDTGKSIVHDCWANHDAVVAELGTLWQAWVAAFVHRKAHPDMAQNWHDRWLPGFMARRATWYHSDCRSGAPCRQERHTNVGNT